MLSLFLVVISFSYAQTGSNTVKGHISFKNSASSTFSRGKSYDTEAAGQSHEKKQINDINAPRKNVFISLHPLNFQAILTSVDAQITQREKTFLPNFVAITKHSTVYFLNEDEHFHNIYSLTPRARFNIGRRPPGNVYGKKIDKAGIIKLGCDIHPEMGAVILSLDTPYFTKIHEDGTFQISGLPDGKYELRAYHPAFQAYTTVLECKGGSIITHNFKL